MKEITVVSGKGGTGKTSITAALATAGRNLVICDSDVDAPDLHLILQPEILETHVFEGNWICEIDQNLCTACGICLDYCRFNAILPSHVGWEIHPVKCEGCRLCERVCPAEAINSERSTQNKWFVSRTRVGIMTHASMQAGEENSGKLVTKVRQKARELAKETHVEYILTDGPPGTGCSSIASITGTDAVLLVLEPSISSLHDAKRVIELVKGFRIPIYALINKSDLHPGMTLQTRTYLQNADVKLLGEIPFAEAMVKAMIEGKSIQEYEPESSPSKTISSLWEEIGRKPA